MREFSVQATVGRPQVAYRETILKLAEAEHKHIKQSGGRGQYGHVKLTVQPLPSAGHEDMRDMSIDELDELAKQVAGKGGKWRFDKEHRLLFIDKIIGGAIPKEFVAPIESGVKEAMENGVLAGYEMVDLAVTVIDGSYHDVDSSEMAFKIAGSMAFKEACRRATPKLLEPIMKVEVVVPEDYMGPVIADLNSRRGQMQGRESRSGTEIINVQVPLSGYVRLCGPIFAAGRRAAAVLQCTFRTISSPRNQSRRNYRREEWKRGPRKSSNLDGPPARR